MGSCIQCAQCVRVCRGNVALVEGAPVINLNGCIVCGHCVAVCPTDAIEHPLSPRQELVGEILPSAQAKRFLRTARSVRLYKPEEIDRESMLELLDIGRYAQTGSNTQGVSYLVLGKAKTASLLEFFCCLVEKGAGEDPSMDWIAGIVKRYRETGYDGILRGAPQLILALTEESRGRENARFALTFIALYAPSLGLGTCWAGILERMICAPEYEEAFRKFLGIPQNLRVRGALMAGYPDVTFKRLVARNALAAEFLD